jgi:hypothetical protein
MYDDQFSDLREVYRLLGELHHKLRVAIEAAVKFNLPLEAIEIMSALDDLKALGPRLDAILAALPADVATAVAAQKAADAAAVTAAQDALTAAQAAATQAESDLAAEVATLTTKIAALETAAGVQPPPAGLTVGAISIPVGSTSAVPTGVSGGVAPYTASGLPAGLTFDGSNIVPDGTQTAGATSITFSDSSTPALTVTATVTVA